MGLIRENTWGVIGRKPGKMGKAFKSANPVVWERRREGRKSGWKHLKFQEVWNIHKDQWETLKPKMISQPTQHRGRQVSMQGSNCILTAWSQTSDIHLPVKRPRQGGKLSALGLAGDSSKKHSLPWGCTVRERQWEFSQCGKTIDSQWMFAVVNLSHYGVSVTKAESTGIANRGNLVQGTHYRGDGRP